MFILDRCKPQNCTSAEAHSNQLVEVGVGLRSDVRKDINIKRTEKTRPDTRLPKSCAGGQEG